MNWGLVLAIAGAFVITLGVIFYYYNRAALWDQLYNNPNKIPVPGKSGQYFETNCCGLRDAAAVPNGKSLTVEQARTLLTTSPWAIGAWVIGALMFLGGSIWGIVSSAKANKDKTLADLIPLLALSSKSSTPNESAALTDLLKNLDTKTLQSLAAKTP